VSGEIVGNGWVVRGERHCQEHIKAVKDVNRRATVEAVAIEKLEQKVVSGEATEAQVVERQRKSVMGSKQQWQRLNNVALEERKQSC
jgi:hypothetical protein